MLGVAPRLAATVAVRPHLLDAAIDPALQRDAAPGEIEARVAARMGTTEEVLDRARDVAREESFLIGLRLLAGSVSPSRAGEAYSDLAGAILRALLDRTERISPPTTAASPGGSRRRRAWASSARAR